MTLIWNNDLIDLKNHGADDPIKLVGGLEHGFYFSIYWE